MHHVYSPIKGDQLCPLGFHPQVRWPTRCKRCFRDYKEHGTKRGDDVAASSPNLLDPSNSRNRDFNTTDKSIGRSWTSTSNLSTLSSTDNARIASIQKRPSSWTSTPDLDESNGKSEVTVNLPLPKRRHTTILNSSDIEESITMKRPPLPPSSKEAPEDLVILRTDSLAERARKMQLLKRQSSLEREGSREKSITKTVETEKPPIPEPKSIIKKPDRKDKSTSSKNEAVAKKKDVQFLIQIKDTQKKYSEDTASTTTETTETTLVDTKGTHEFLEQIESLKRELQDTKSRAERAERDKSDILLRRLASMDTVPNRTAASEALKLQQKVNELSQQLEDIRDDKKCLAIKVKELEQDLNVRPTKSSDEELRRKLQAAETLCEELVEENEDMKKELKNMEQEIDEMQDNFRDEQLDEYRTLRKELEQATKNCRIMQFKYKKSERKIEQLELEKQNLGNQVQNELQTKMKKLEEELRISNEVARQLQSEVDNNNTLKVPKGKAPSLGMIGKSTSADGKISRGSLTRGGSQEDPVQLLRDLQDSMERETDIREQLKYAEEEAENARKKVARVEDENESLMMQLKKMASKARSRKLSPSQLPLEAPLEKDEGISDEEDPAELRVLLELNEQESSQLRRKVEELETNYEASKKQIKELQEKMKQNTKQQSSIKGKLPTFMSKTLAGDKDNEKKLKEVEKEVTELKKQITEKDKSINELQILKQNSVADAKELVVVSQQNVDYKRKLESVEQETKTLRDRVQLLEVDNEKFCTENKKLALHAARLARKDSSSAGDKEKLKELAKMQETLSKIEKEKIELQNKLKTILEIPPERMAPRVPKKYSDLNTKLQLQKLLEEQEDEIKEMRAIVLRTGGDKLQRLESEKNSTQSELKVVKEQLSSANAEIKLLKNKKEAEQTSKLTELEQKHKKITDDSIKLQAKVKDAEEKLSKQDSVIKQLESSKSLLEKQMKFDQEKYAKLENDSEKEKKDKLRNETKIQDLNREISAQKTAFDKTKSTLEKEISTLKAKANTTDTVPTKKVQELRRQIDELQTELDRDKMRYTELNANYERLEEEHLFNKAQLTSEKEKLQNEISSLRTKLGKFESDLSLVQKDKTDLSKKFIEAQSKISELEKRSVKSSSMELENSRMKAIVLAKEEEYRNLKEENEMNRDVGIQLKREIDELKKKLADFEKVNKVQNSLNDHSSSLEQEIKRLTQKLESTEVSAKSDVASTRLRYEQQIKTLHGELNSMQRQCERFKRDRDTFKQLLEGAQKTIGDLKSNNSGRASRASMNSGDEDDKSKIVALEQQIGCLEDELSEARLETSKIKTELVSEKSVFEIKISEMQSRFNEYEEDRLIGSGRAKVAGLKTKLELSWQKEREEQQRILQETATLARDLRQTLFEVERERDKERLDSKRKLEMLKRGNDEELDEGRKKISELQSDLLELRDAHAKLRTTNEKLRRERERYERDREMVARKRMEQDGEKKINMLLEAVEEICKAAPDLTPAIPPKSIISTGQTNSHLSPPRRSRSPSPARVNVQMANLLARLAEASEEVKKYNRPSDDEKSRRSSSRRAASSETDTPEMSRHTIRISRSSAQNGSLFRKSISFDQSIQQEQQSIWKHEDGSMSSIQSIESEARYRHSSMDSRLSGGSTQSDMPRGPRKKKRGFMGKLRSLTKGIGTESEGSLQGSDSDISISSDYKSSKSNLKGKLSGMFKRSSSASRASSTERSVNDSTQRPVSVTSINISNGPTQLPPPTTPRMRRSTSRPPTPSSSTPSTQRKAK